MKEHTEDDRVDTVLQETKTTQPEIKCQVVEREGMDDVVKKYLKIYGLRTDTYNSLVDDETTERSRLVKLNEMPESVGYEVLVALATHYGYELVPK